MTGRRPSGQLEGQILDILGKSTACSVADVREQLGGTLAHTTVMTALVRLTAKGLLRRQRHGRSFRYSLVAPVESLPALRAALRMRTELDARDERADVLANFVAALDPADEALLKGILDASARDGKSEERS